MKIALFGLPACGKGTQAKLLEQAFGLEQLSTGDLIRQLQASDRGPVGEALRALPVGTFASDALILQAVAQALRAPKYAQGVIFDGFPRTLDQAKALPSVGVQLDAVVYFKADEDVLVERAVNRRVHVASGRVYNLKSAPPKVAGRDDQTGEPLTHRQDDHEVITRRRFLDFHAKTLPAIEFLHEKSQLHQAPAGPALLYLEVDAMRPAPVVFEQLESALRAHQAQLSDRTSPLPSPLAAEGAPVKAKLRR